MSAIIEDQGTVKKTNCAHFFCPILRGMVLIVALRAFTALLRAFLLAGEKWEGALLLYIAASLMLKALIPKPESSPASLPQY
jgi:hypothetical protein